MLCDGAQAVLRVEPFAQHHRGANRGGDLQRREPPGMEQRGGDEHPLADLQRLALEYRIGLPTTFALVGKTLAQADTIARTLDPELDPVELIEEHALDVIAAGTARRLDPKPVVGRRWPRLPTASRGSP